MEASQLATWMKQEYTKVNELAYRLREHIVDVPSGGLASWLDELGKRYEHFAAHIRRLMHIAEQDGYLLPVLEQRPTLSRQVELLRHEHDELRWLLDDLHKAIRATQPGDQLLVRDCCARLQTLLGHVQRHQEHENHIVLYTLTQDTGAHD